jgi:hypothetical protein
MTIKKLTDRERFELAHYPDARGKALVIIDALTAENERLRAVRQDDLDECERLCILANAAESRLATAVGLLAQCVRELRHCHSAAPVIEQSDAFLAAAPAQPAAPARTEAEQDRADRVLSWAGPAARADLGLK